jgi:YfiH family protein
MMPDDPPFLTSAPLEALDGLRHGFFTRRGGVSKGIYASLNCGLGSADDPAAVRENRRRLAAALGVQPDRLLSLYQIHSPRAVVAEATFDTDGRPEADALVTDKPGLALAIATADCAPVLFACATSGVIGAAHAGWKGAFGGVLESTLEQMEGLGANRSAIVAAIGPCIGQDAYEVGPEFEARFREAPSANFDFFRPADRTDHWLFDLDGFVRSRLAKAGVRTVDALGQCTYSQEDRFFSFRRATHRSEPDYGRMLSAIVIKDGEP